MQEKLNLLKCNICKNIVQITKAGNGELVCCEKPMELLKDNEVDSSNPHYANIEKINEKERKIFFNHEMTKEHWIEFVEVISNDKKYIKRKYFELGEKPELILKCDCNKGYFIRVYCNIHNICTTKNIEEK